MHVEAAEPTGGLTACERDPSSSCEVAYIVESDARVRESLVVELELARITARGFSCAAEYFTCIRQDSAACIIINVQSPDMDGFESLSRQQRGGSVPTIFISAQADIRSGIRAIKAGAFDFLFHPIDAGTLICAVKDAFSRDRQVRQRRAEFSGLNERYLRLTPREREVFGLVVRGFLNKQVAALLVISQITVQIHRGNLMRKMAALSFADLVCMAIRLQILGNDPAERSNLGVSESFMLSRIGTW